MACTQASDCAPSQTCGEDGFCAAASIAGTCAQIAATDAGVDAPQSKPPDAAPPDAPPSTVRLFVRIEGRGVVTIPTIGECDGGSGGTDCMFDVPKGAPTTLHGAPKNNWRFQEWKDACEFSPTATCLLTPNEDTQVRARFVMIDDDGDDD